ncbi:hypothetical protein DH2020_004886 [Rehmannia glutinosa]|uniref:Secreted protein n=1 Tax=Rehmannia glutinosa TaxID=99300 RepID=A0ABR0XR06_REHGL
MGSKVIVFLGLFLATILLISSEAAARNWLRLPILQRCQISRRRIWRLSRRRIWRISRGDTVDTRVDTGVTRDVAGMVVDTPDAVVMVVDTLVVVAMVVATADMVAVAGATTEEAVAVLQLRW